MSINANLLRKYPPGRHKGTYSTPVGGDCFPHGYLELLTTPQAMNKFTYVQYMACEHKYAMKLLVQTSCVYIHSFELGKFFV